MKHETWNMEHEAWIMKYRTPETDRKGKQMGWIAFQIMVLGKEEYLSS